jgi:DNA-directed RNA polymerase subunit RPC12/RpoP
MAVYYVCGECGIVLGNTPEMRIKPGDVIACWNCGTHNELRIDSEICRAEPGT